MPPYVERSNMAERYTIEDHQAYREKVDEAARKKRQELDEKLEKATAMERLDLGGR
jgi:hypothetical protein